MRTAAIIKFTLDNVPQKGIARKSYWCLLKDGSVVFIECGWGLYLTKEEQQRLEDNLVCVMCLVRIKLKYNPLNN